ncbi:unnamed protein product, partial [Meganyctiphanes norvegica]
LNKSDEIIINEDILNENFALSEEQLIGTSVGSNENLLQEIRNDFTPKSHSFETDLKNQMIFNSLNNVQNKEKGWKNVILEWYKAVEIFPNYMVNSITNLKSYDKGIEKYLQVVWAATEEIGCTVIHYIDNQGSEAGINQDDDYKEDRISSIYVCNYGPAAIRDKSSSVYVVGDAVSQCQDGVSPTYSDLCSSNHTMS